MVADRIQKIKEIIADKETDEYKLYAKGKRLRTHWAETVIVHT